MIFCSHCGNMTKKIFVEGDSRKRDICVICNQINYVNPSMDVTRAFIDFLNKEQKRIEEDL